MSKRRPRWSALEMPWLRQGLYATAVHEVDRIDALRQRAIDIGRDDLAEQFDSGGRGYERIVSRMPGASLWWVTSEMAEVAMDAAMDVPSIRLEDAPDDVGLIAAATPWPAYDTTAIGGLALRDGIRTDIPHNDPVPVDAMTWMLSGDELTVGLCCRAHRLPLPLTTHDGPLVEFATLTTTLPAMLGEPISSMGPEGVTPASHARGVLSLLSACWVLMMTPTVAERRTLDTGTGGAGSAETRPDRLVTTVDLRPLRQVHAEQEPGSSGRHLTTRHMVRGHWTSQPYGPGNSLRRLHWVAPYVRGPEGAPLVVREQVHVWRR